MIIKWENLDMEKLTETAATRRGCVTPTTLPSAVQPASARYCKQIFRERSRYDQEVLALHTVCLAPILTQAYA